MDPSYYNSSYGQRHARFSSHPLSPHPQSYSGNPNLYGGHNHDSHSYYHLSVHSPSLPPVNQSASYYSTAAPPPPPPPHAPYNPHQRTYSSQQVLQPLTFSSSSRIQSQDVSRSSWAGYQEATPGSWEPSVGTDFSYQFDYSRLSADRSGDGFGQGLDSNSRFRDEFSDHRFAREEFGLRRIGENHNCRNQFQLDSDKSSRGLGVGNRSFETISGYRDNQYGSAVDGEVIRHAASNENQRWIVENEVTNGFGARFVQKSEIEGYLNEGSRADGVVLNRTVRNQVQKKSVLLRIQNPRPNQRSREIDRSRYFCHYNEKKSGSFRGRDLPGRSDPAFGEKQREKTPMELDVSFKSNALVAKATKTPTSVGTDSGIKVTPRSSKIRRVLATDKVDKVLLNEGTAKVGSNTHVARKVSSSDKGFKQSKREVTGSGVDKQYASNSICTSSAYEGKIKEEKSFEDAVLDRKVMVTGKDIKSLLDEATAKVDRSQHVAKQASGSEEALKHSKEDFGANVSDWKIDAEMSAKNTLSGKSSSSSDAPFLKVVMKKKVMKKLVKKVTKSPSELPVSKSIEKLSKPVEARNFCHGASMMSENEEGDKCLEKEVPFAGLSSLCGVGSQPCKNGVSETDKKDESSNDLLSKVDDVGIEDGKVCADSLGHREVEIDKRSINAESFSNQVVSDLLSTEFIMSNMDKIEDGSEIHQKRDSLLPENNGMKDIHKDVFSPGGNTESQTLNSEKNNDEGLAIFNHPFCEMNSANRFDSLNREVVSGTGRLNPAGSQGFENEVGPSVESGGMEGSSESSAFTHSSVTLPSQCLEKTRDNLVPQASGYCNYENTCSNPSGGLNIAEETRFKSIGDEAREAYGNIVASFSENGATKGYLEVMRIGGGEHDMLGFCKNRDALSCELDLSKAVLPHTSGDSVNVVSTSYGEDATLKNCFPAEDVALDTVCINTCLDGASVLHNFGFTPCCPNSKVLLGNDITIDPSRTPLEREARVKIPSFRGTFFSPSTSVADNNSVTANIDKSGMEMVSHSEDCPQSKEIKLSYATIRCSSELRPFSEGVKELLGNHSGCESSDGIGSVTDSCLICGLINDHSRFNSCLVSTSVLVSEQTENAIPTTASSNFESELTDKELGREENLDANAPKEQLIPSDEAAKCRTAGTDLGPGTGDLAVLCGSSLNPSGLGCRQIGIGSPAASGSNSHDEMMDAESNKRENSSLDAVQERIMTFQVAVHDGNSLLNYGLCSGHTLPGTDVESDELPVSNYTPLPAYQDVVPTDKLTSDLSDTLPDTQSDTGSRENLPVTVGIQPLKIEASCFPVSDEKFCGNDRILEDRYGGVIGSVASSSSHSNGRIENAASRAKQDDSDTLLLTDSKNKAKPLSSMSQEAQGRKNDFNHTVQKSCPASFLFAGNRNVKAPNRTTKPCSWHRSSNASSLPATKPLPSTPLTRGQSKTISEVRSTYIRKGNSLLRKPAFGRDAPVLRTSANELSVSNVDKVKPIGSERSAVVDDSSNLLKAGGIHASLGKLPTPPLASITEVSNHVTVPLVECTLSPRAEPLSNDFRKATTDSLKPRETDVLSTCEDGLKTFETPENQTDHVSESLKEGIAYDVASSNPRKIVYVKRKSNQLVAASNIYSSEIQIASFDGYYKRRKNQLVRTSDSHAKQPVSSSDDALNAQLLVAAPKMVSKRNFGAAFSNDRAVTKPVKHSKFSLVWTLNGTRLKKTNRVTLRRQKFLPQLFPWKRTTYWRGLMNSFSVSRNNSLSKIGKKLLLLRKRHTVYTRSINGYSLRKSKVLSIGGSHLKWSKSIERDSKKANEEATSAVAAMAKRKGEHRSGTGISAQKNRSHFARERIFRISSVRYKMDPSRRTLQRISDDESPCSNTPKSGNDAKRSIVPRRLMIGNDEYVRVGNGNQLIRDPKKRTRALASEKVRWSLHTARLRLANKRKYCQFFTRFGECSKDDGKCPYIHDPSKIAVCTKFLNGLCTNPNCKLTHKVIPERMPDCSYFQLGLCNNEACPYRHVHVNPNAATCEGFLRGYCANGDECPKKHTCTCPIFEATGSCPQGSKCKLHHPKRRSKGRSRKRPYEQSQKNVRGRYFGSLHNNIAEPESMVPDRGIAENAVFGGETADYISLDVSEDEMAESNGLLTEQALFDESGPLDMQFGDIDELIKPVGIMDKKPIA